VFVGGNSTPGVAQFVQGLRQQAEACGRHADDIKVFSMMSVIVADTDELAKAKHQDYLRYGLAEGALALMSGWTGVDLSAYGLDERAENISTEAVQSAMRGLGLRTVGEWAEFLAVGGGAPTIVGSPATVADELQRWMDEAGIDGFNLAYTVMPESVDEFVELVVPELQRRGVYKTAYARGTFRDKLTGQGPRLRAPHPAVQARQLT